MRSGWELIRQSRATGLWSTVSRSFDKTAYADYQRWIDLNSANQKGTFLLRQVYEDTDYLVDSLYPQALEQLEKDEQAMADRETTIKNDAFALGNAIATVLKNPNNPDLISSAVFTIARRFAKFADYADADSALTYIEGFVSGFQNGSETNQKAIESGGGGVNSQ